ncbi:MAG TPA: hypothetical protein VGP63_19045, partial [Planctomycetaceae bacterium]|nr:hypothetical protein [Planctomycetaceae bacterium]
MSLLNRAATGVFSLALVSALLIGGHRIAGGKKSRSVPAPARHTTNSAPAVSWMPDCKMPESPPASGPVRTSHLAGFTQLTSDGDQACLPAQEPLQSVIHAASKGEAAPERGGSRVADASESSASPFSQPMPLPARTDAIPLRPEGPDLPSVAEPPVSAPWSHGPNSPGRKIIERALPNSSAEERDAWHDALKDLAPKDVRELMRLRQELGRMPPSLFESRPPVGQLPVGQLPIGQLPGAQPLWNQPVPSQIASEPIAPPAESRQPRLDAEREVARTIGMSLYTINQAQQNLLNSIASELHELERLRRQAHALELA